MCQSDCHYLWSHSIVLCCFQMCIQHAESCLEMLDISLLHNTALTITCSTTFRAEVVICRVRLGSQARQRSFW